jgi:aerobic-type carbon monoxide dehydrogenase small subunit (CoxS/CutS family)
VASVIAFGSGTCGGDGFGEPLVELLQRVGVRGVLAQFGALVAFAQVGDVNINGKDVAVDADPSTPILWALRDTLGLTGTKFGCGQALCGACTVHLNGSPIRSCVTPVSAAAGQKITTIEAIGNDRVGKAVQAAWVKHDVAQCGYCQSGQVMSATACSSPTASPPTPTSTRPWPATSAAAAPTPASVRPSRTRARASPEGAAMHFDPATAADLHKVLSRHGKLPQGAATLERRAFLKVGAASGFALGLFPLAPRAGRAPAAGLKPHEQPSAFVRIDKDGTTTVTINRLDFGQGVQTGLPMVLAEELDADWSKVRSVHGDANPAYADPAFGMHLTGGSNSIKNSYTQYRELGARTRAMLVAAAAQQWKVDAAQLRTENGVVIGPGGKRAGYGELAEAAMQQPVPQQVQLKDPKQFRLIGKPTGRLDARAKSTGNQAYGIDVRLPGMLTAVVARPPVFGAKVKSVDDSAAKAIKGVKAVVRVPVDRGGMGVAVIADGYWPAKQGRDALKLEWDTSGVEKADTTQAAGPVQGTGQASPASSPEGRCVEAGRRAEQAGAEFSFPYLAHAPMEPLNCTVAYDGSKAELWMGTQMPGLDAMAAAKTLGVAPSAIKINTQMAGGGFGRRAIPTSDYVVEACNVAKARARPASTRRCARCGAARTTSRAATTGRCTCTAPRSAGTRRATSWPGTTSSSASRS